MRLKQLHTDEHISINELTLRDLLKLSKVSDPQEFYLAITQLVPAGNVVEMLLYLFALRQKSFAEYLELNSTKGQAIKYYISNIINAIRQVPQIACVAATNGYAVHLDYPSIPSNDPIPFIIQQIDDINLTELSATERISLCEQLPASITQSAVDFINGAPQTLVLIPANEKLGIRELSVNVFDTSIVSLVHMLFSGANTNQLLETVFRMNKHITDTQFILDRSPHEIDFMNRLASEN